MYDNTMDGMAGAAGMEDETETPDEGGEGLLMQLLEQSKGGQNSKQGMKPQMPPPSNMENPEMMNGV